MLESPKLVFDLCCRMSLLSAMEMTAFSRGFQINKHMDVKSIDRQKCYGWDVKLTDTTKWWFYIVTRVWWIYFYEDYDTSYVVGYTLCLIFLRRGIIWLVVVVVAVNVLAALVCHSIICYVAKYTCNHRLLSRDPRRSYGICAQVRNALPGKDTTGSSLG